METYLKTLLSTPSLKYRCSRSSSNQYCFKISKSMYLTSCPTWAWPQLKLALTSQRVSGTTWTKISFKIFVTILTQMVILLIWQAMSCPSWIVSVQALHTQECLQSLSSWVLTNMTPSTPTISSQLISKCIPRSIARLAWKLAPSVSGTKMLFLTMKQLKSLIQRQMPLLSVKILSENTIWRFSSLNVPAQMISQWPFILVMPSKKRWFSGKSHSCS